MGDEEHVLLFDRQCHFLVQQLDGESSGEGGFLESRQRCATGCICQLHSFGLLVGHLPGWLSHAEFNFPLDFLFANHVA